MEALNNWQEEKRSAYLYRAIAEVELNNLHKSLFLNLADMSDKQAAIWEQKMRAAHISIPTAYHPDWRTRLIAWLATKLGPKAVRVALSSMKVRGMSIYSAHGQRERRRHGASSSNNLRAGVFGMSDGLLSNASLMLGVAGANTGQNIILLAGIAGLLAGACSMGAGEYVSVRSQREMLQYQLALEKSELETYPEEEAAELALIYQARGLSKEDAEKIAHLLIQNPEHALDTLAREELGINPNELASPWGAAFSSFFCFSCGAFIPMIPYLFSDSKINLPLSIILTGCAMFTVGALLSLLTQQHIIRGGLRMLFIGAAAGCLTYFIGNFLGIHNI